MLLSHLQKVRGLKVEKTSPGIYTVIGDTLPIQIIDNRELPSKENIWLKDLNNNLDAPEISRLLTKIHRHSSGAQIGIYLDVVTRANTEAIEEAMKMSKAAKSLDEVFIIRNKCCILSLVYMH